MGLDKSLIALAGCPVIPDEKGYMKFGPYPVIFAPNDEILSHEICHVLAGRKDFAVFDTACKVRKSELYNLILNLMYDWYHEHLYSNKSGYLKNRIDKLHSDVPPIPTNTPAGIKELFELYDTGKRPAGMPEIKSVLDLVVWADMMFGEMEKRLSEHWMSKFCKVLKDAGRGAGPQDLSGTPKRSEYYQSAVAKYYPIIETLSELWKRNKYGWINQYFGEIDWKDLVGTFLGNELSLPVFKLFAKIAMSRQIYLVIDRSGSTDDIKTQIMDTAIIIAESLRMCEVPISILDVGVTDSIVNSIDEELDLGWFTPQAVGGTPLGKVCLQIRDATPDSYLLIITDGQPYNWKTLMQALNAFPGEYLTFVIGEGNLYTEYVSHTNDRAILVEPNTIIREMLDANSLT